jgi:hypothetical protein
VEPGELEEGASGAVPQTNMRERKWVKKKKIYTQKYIYYFFLCEENVFTSLGESSSSGGGTRCNDVKCIPGEWTHLL